MTLMSMFKQLFPSPCFFFPAFPICVTNKRRAFHTTVSHLAYELRGFFAYRWTDRKILILLSAFWNPLKHYWSLLLITSVSRTTLQTEDLLVFGSHISDRTHKDTKRFHYLYFILFIGFKSCFSAIWHSILHFVQLLRAPCTVSRHCVWWK